MNIDRRQQLFDQARGGDTNALGSLFQEFQLYVRMLARAIEHRRLQGRLGESDLIQDALLEAHRGFPAFRGGTLAEFTAWLRQIVIGSVGRTLRTHLGTGKRNMSLEQRTQFIKPLIDPRSSPSQQAARHEEVAQIAALLEGLPEDMRQVLVGRHIDGLSHAELGAQLGRTEAAVRMVYLRALRRLRDERQVAQSLSEIRKS